MTTAPVSSLSSPATTPPRRMLLAIGLAIITFIAFLPALSCGFINFDDTTYVTANAFVQQGLSKSNILAALTRTQMYLWHPLTMISLMLDFQLFGMDAFAFHLENILIHVASVLLLFVLLHRMTGSLWRSALVAAVFGIHPLRVESVVWVAERKDVLSVFFVLLAMLAYVGYARQPKWWKYAAVAIALLLSLLAKPMFVTLPFLLLLLDAWPLRRFAANDPATHNRLRRLAVLVAEKVPMLCICVAVLAIQFVLTARNLAGQNPHAYVEEGRTFPLSLRMANAPVSYVRYLAKMVDVSRLSVFYPMPPAWPAWQVAASLFLLVAVTIVVLLLARRYAHLPVGWLWFLGTMVPVLGVLTQVSDYSMADRYTYFSCIGLLIMLVWSIPDRWAISSAGRTRLSLAAGVAVAALGFATWTQCLYWTNSRSLFEHTLEVTPDHPLSRLNLGQALADQGELDDAIVQFRRVLELRPTHRDAWYNLGQALMMKQQYPQALAAYRKGAEIDPLHDRTFEAIAYVLSQQGDAAGAIAHYRKAVELNPQNAFAYTNMANLLVASGKLEDAIPCYQKAIEISPGSAMAHAGLASAFLSTGQIEQSIRESQCALAISPNMAAAHYKLGLALTKQRQFPAAIEHFREAMQSNPNDPDLRAALDQALLAQQGR